MAAYTPIIVLSHLRWNWVYQRPQHLLSRLARWYDVWMIEEPVHDPQAGEPRVDIRDVAPGVHVCQFHTALNESGFTPAQITQLAPAVRKLIADQRLNDPIAWVYTPMAIGLLGAIEPRAVVYDCMDELSGFRGA